MMTYVYSNILYDELTLSIFEGYFLWDFCNNSCKSKSVCIAWCKAVCKYRASISIHICFKYIGQSYTSHACCARRSWGNSGDTPAAASKPQSERLRNFFLLKLWNCCAIKCCNNLFSGRKYSIALGSVPWPFKRSLSLTAVIESL